MARRSQKSSGSVFSGVIPKARVFSTGPGDIPSAPPVQVEPHLYRFCPALAFAAVPSENRVVATIIVARNPIAFHTTHACPKNYWPPLLDVAGVGGMRPCFRRFRGRSRSRPACVFAPLPLSRRRADGG